MTLPGLLRNVHPLQLLHGTYTAAVTAREEPGANSRQRIVTPLAEEWMPGKAYTRSKLALMMSTG